jgi:sterol desaturase/sphingolipid hydroxylase (fatty acid hydroxylase superfamily)
VSATTDSALISERARRILSVSIYPVVMGAAMAASMFGIERGWSPVLVLAVVSPAIWVILIFGEHQLPHRPEWNVARGDLRTDLCHFVVNFKSPQLYLVLLSALLLPLSGVLSQHWAIHLWPSGWPLLGQTALALVVAEFGQYWAHRLSHERDFLWRLHATHHSAERLYWVNAARDHPLGLFVLYGGSVVPLLLMGCNEKSLAMYFLFSVINGLFKHCNIDLRLGPLNWIFSMAELHRWHHSTNLEEARHNYGANLLLWDIVFGTRYAPPEPTPSTLGILEMPDFPKTYLCQLAVPFRWRSIRRS